VETDQEYVDTPAPTRPCSSWRCHRAIDAAAPCFVSPRVTDTAVALELKETHLGPLANTFSRSPSAPTISEKDDRSQGALSGTATPTNESTIGAYHLYPSASAPSPCPLFPPVLTVVS
jgi:hypothetical protein